MIDYWLILCQLVPFIQVVLVTALEFLRDDVLVHKHIRKQQKFSEPSNGEQKEKTPFKMPAEVKPEEAWAQPDTIDPLTLLGAIGEFYKLSATCLSFVLFFFLVYLVSICSATLSQLLIDLFTWSQLIPSFENSENIKNFPLREEADADDCALRLHNLHWNCCNFLFRFTLNLILWTNFNLYCSWCLQVLQNKLFESEAKWYSFIMILGYLADSFTSCC